ncbi:hypothetical protein [Arthrobacter woluwensis]|uniref:hypothetical protein n=1 Tax=Arthrobacter woluwensis TaxID=156980 RepID=UPI0038142855
MKHQRILTEVQDEMVRQDEKWGEQNHPDGTGPEVGIGYVGTSAEICDVAREQTDAAAKAGELTFSHILAEEFFEALAESDPAALRTELIQVAAVAIQWAGAIDRRADLAQAAEGRALVDAILARQVGDGLPAPFAAETIWSVLERPATPSPFSSVEVEFESEATARAHWEANQPSLLTKTTQEFWAQGDIPELWRESRA